MDLTAWMEENGMLPSGGGTVLCAVSGGRDSVCLLHYLHGLAAQYGFSVAAGHYNHHMRPTAQRDELFVRELCRRLEIPFYSEGCDVAAAAVAAGRGVEEMGRELRYAFLERLADRIGAERIATAHHQADQAETVLLNLTRGTGPEGLSGIPPVRGRLIRPLLQTSRQEIEAYLAQNDLTYVEDETNEELCFSRNRLRRVLMPELEKINPAVRQNIARTARIISRENQYLDDLAGAYLEEKGTAIACRVLLDAPQALQPRIVRLLIDRLGGGKKNITAGHLSAVLELARRGRGMAALSGGMVAVCRNDRLELRRLPPTGEEMLLTTGEQFWGEWRITVRETETLPTPAGESLCFAPALSGQLSAGRWYGGEGLRLPGSRGARSIKRLLTERGVPAEERLGTPCVRCAGQVAGVYGLGTDVDYLPEASGGAIEIIFQKTKGYGRTQE